MNGRVFQARDLTARVIRKASGVFGGPRALETLANVVDARVHVRDPFTSWLMLANAGMMDPGNLHCFDHAIARLPSDAPIVEVGAFCGLSTNLLAHFKRVHGRHNPVISCDPWIFEGAGGADQRIGSSPVTYGELRALVMDSFRRNVSTFSADDLPFSVELTSDAFFDAWRRADVVPDIFGRQVRLGGPLSMAFIDGDHRYPQARRDVENADAMLVPGGFLFLDDTADGLSYGSCRVRDELLRSAAHELVIANPNYLFRRR